MLPRDMKNYRAEDYEPLPDPVLIMDLGAMALGILFLVMCLA